jgi:hypothetical protein
MAKEWKAGDRIPIAYINDLERKAEAYARLIQAKAKSARATAKEDESSEQPSKDEQ